MSEAQATDIGPNAWVVDEMYEQFLADPQSVSESWREFFADYRPDGAATRSGTEAPPQEPASSNGASNANATTDVEVTSDGSITAWSWTFGDDTDGSTAQNPSHTYARVGSYTAKLTITYAGGETAT